MKNKKNIQISVLIAFFIIAFVILTKELVFKNKTTPELSSLPVTTINSEIMAQGSIRSVNEATLHFQTGGKLVYLPFKEGEVVNAGQTIAQLDSYALQKQLTASLNNYKIARDTFDQTADNGQSGVLKGSSLYSLTVLNKGGFDPANVIGDVVKRILEQNQATLDNSVINVELANYAISLSTLTSPIDGVVYHEDVDLPYVNVTPATSFVIIDPNQLVLRTNISSADIDFISIGASATIQIDGSGNKFNGTVTKIYPEKVTLPNGGSVYQVDIQSDALGRSVKYGVTGSVLIKSNIQNSVRLIPTWTLLGNNLVWVISNNKTILRKVTPGTVHGENVEILKGLLENDRIITNPQYIVAGRYQIL